LAYSLENFSQHPIAQAVVKKAKELKLKVFQVSKFKSITGFGVTGVIFGKKYYVGKLLKNEARQLIDNLKKIGIEVYMVTGDSKKTALAVGKFLGILEKNVFGKMLPINLIYFGHLFII